MKIAAFSLVLLLFANIASSESGPLATAVQQGLLEEEVNRDLAAAITAYETAVQHFDNDRPLAAVAMFRLAEAYRRAGRTPEAEALYERVAREFHDQPELVRRATDQLPAGAASRQAAAPPSGEFSPVTIHVQTGDGRPVEGIRVTMTAKASRSPDGPRVVASGTSDSTGLALTRNLPYGEYYLRAESAFGWRTDSSSVNVEIGLPSTRTVVVPDPEDRASLTIESALGKEAFAGIKFGKARRSGDQPELENKLPEIGSGIEQVVLRVGIDAQRSLAQAEATEWRWNWSQAVYVSLEGLLKNQEPIVHSRSRFPRTGPLGPEISYQGMSLAPLPEGGQSLQIPSGEITISLLEILGKPDREARAAFGLPADEEVWLPANLDVHSEWLARRFDPADWPHSSPNALVWKKIEIPAGEAAMIRLGASEPRN